jgi:hypothetical protein
MFKAIQDSKNDTERNALIWKCLKLSADILRTYSMFENIFFIEPMLYSYVLDSARKILADPSFTFNAGTSRSVTKGIIAEASFMVEMFRSQNIEIKRKRDTMSDSEGPLHPKKAVRI